MSEQTVGRIRNDLGWDRRYSTQRCSVCGAPRHPRIHGVVPKRTNQDSASLKEFGFAMVVCLLVGIAFWLWAGILAVAS